MYIYDIDIVKQLLHANKALTDSEVLKNIITTDVTSIFKNNMALGKEYYKSKNTAINTRNFTYFSNGKSIVDEWRSNNKIAHGFLKVLIDQKVNYSFSKKITINNAENITKVVDVNTFIRKVVKEASKKAVGWVHPYINKDGKFEIKRIVSEEIIPIFDSEFEDELVQIIRYYTIYVVEGKDKKTRYKVEIWDSEKVSYYVEDSAGNFLFDNTITINPAQHWNTITYVLGNPTNTEGHSWGKVPFIPLWNNEERETDLSIIKDLIDSYDKVMSDFCNNLDDLQDAIIKLINYGGMSDKLDEFLEYLKKYKVLPLDDNGNAEYMTTEIPTEARKVVTAMLRDSIYEFGQGVDIQKVGDGNITNVVIRNRYAGLDLKANDLEAEVEEFLKQVFWFANEYLKITNQQTDNISYIEIIFNRSLIINNAETVDMAQKSKGMISNRTIISNHPWVNDVDSELENMEQDRKDDIESYGIGGIFDKGNISKEENNKDDKENDDMNIEE